MKKEPFIIERTFNAPASLIWKALTDKNEMKKWYFDVSDFKPQPGFEFTFNGGSEEKIYVHFCKVVEVIPEKKLSYSWRYKDYEGNSLLTFELFSEGNQTKLKLTHSGLETFPQGLPDFARTSFEAGWTYVITKSLQEYVDGKK
ncbi:MAG: SRPBCC domain-containing protein [Bacteroidetes bacterium]|nr:SRPBCC domain-containing protein [Bacteroidota bacterium]